MPAHITKGFTLVEVLLYAALSSVIIGSLAIFLHSSLQTKQKNVAIAEVESQGAFVSEKIRSAIANAQSVSSPARGASSTVLTLDMYDAEKNPTIISLSGSTLQIKEGANAAVALTSDRLVASAPTFTNLSTTSTIDSVKTRFNLHYVNPLNKAELDYQKTFYASASARK